MIREASGEYQFSLSNIEPLNLEKIFQRPRAGSGPLSKDASRSQHGQAAVSNFLEGQVFGGGGRLPKVQGVEAKVTWGAVTRLPSFRHGDAGKHCCNNGAVGTNVRKSNIVYFSVK
jgi:hypothetical protein